MLYKLPHGHICAENIFVDNSNAVVASGTGWFLGDIHRHAAMVQGDVAELALLLCSICTGVMINKKKLEQSVKSCTLLPELHSFLHGSISLHEMAKFVQNSLEACKPQKILTLGTNQTGKSTIFKLNSILNDKLDKNCKQV